MGGYEIIDITTDKKSFFNVECLDVFYLNSDNDAIVLTGYKFQQNNYASVPSNGNPAGLEDIADAVSNSVGGGYRNNSPVNTRTFGAAALFEYWNLIYS